MFSTVKIKCKNKIRGETKYSIIEETLEPYWMNSLEIEKKNVLKE